MIEIFRIDHLELSAICKIQLFRVRYVEFAIIASVCLCHIGPNTCQLGNPVDSGAATSTEKEDL